MENNKEVFEGNAEYWDKKLKEVETIGVGI
jgi:hypothetical protein